ncbi:MAG TPA: 50S ribosomal protein L11 methyltransferase [Syntrophorhabdaceae bacterium]|nr:50S ribosomal protein L11 methyltransferase [Syntrophorhabdaceae bacterium]HPP06374.1 50S ribosomal protein L11 methyltransferase [Syntrophorhabdaceae bacterium]
MKKNHTEKHFKLTIKMEKGAEEFLPEEIYMHVKKGLWIEGHTDTSIIICYPDDLEPFLKILKASGLKIKDLTIEEEEIPDYSEITKRYFKTITVCGVKIVPPWGKKIPKGSIVIDPGMAFGTGRHESTKIMIKLMQKIDFKDKDVLDMGCGSGILAIYASMLGAKRVIAVDNDPDAVQSAKGNINLNKVENISIVCADINDIKGAFHVVLANLDIRTFQKYKKHIKKLIKKDGLIVVSGILKKEKEQVFKCFEDLKCTVEEGKNAWTGMVFRSVF